MLYIVAAIFVVFVVYKLFIQPSSSPPPVGMVPKSIDRKKVGGNGDAKGNAPAVKKGPKLSIYFGSQTGTAEGMSC